MKGNGLKALTVIDKHGLIVAIHALIDKDFKPSILSTLSTRSSHPLLQEWDGLVGKVGFFLYKCKLMKYTRACACARGWMMVVRTCACTVETKHACRTAAQLGITCCSSSPDYGIK